MQTRLLACGAGGLLGAALASTINDSLGMPPALALAGCALAGIAVGYFISIMFDVFTASSETPK
jgi:xanthosine utilization system XapX-like protein